MAEGKKGFILYCDQKEIFEQLPLDKRGELITVVFQYVNDENPIVTDPLLKMAFTLIKQVLKRDLVKYETKKIQWSEAGKASAEARRLLKENQQNQQPLTNVESRSTDSTVIVKDNVIVNVKDKVIVKENKIEERKLKFATTLTPFKSKFDSNELKKFYDYWTEPNKSNTKFRQELEKTWSLKRRLETWFNNSKNFKEKSSAKKEIPTTLAQKYAHLMPNFKIDE